jgi:hypothetical protein
MIAVDRLADAEWLAEKDGGRCRRNSKPTQRSPAVPLDTGVEPVQPPDCRQGRIYLVIMGGLVYGERASRPGSRALQRRKTAGRGKSGLHG